MDKSTQRIVIFKEYAGNQLETSKEWEILKFSVKASSTENLKVFEVSSPQEYEMLKKKLETQGWSEVLSKSSGKYVTHWTRTQAQ